MAKFEIGKSYYSMDCGIDAITVIRRTEKTIWVSNGTSEWCMRIKHDCDGREYVVDSCVPEKWRGVFTYGSWRPTEEFE